MNKTWLLNLSCNNVHFFVLGFFFFFFFLGHTHSLWKVPCLGVNWRWRRLYTTAHPDPSRICDLYHSSWQCHILNPLREARDWTCILVDSGWVCNCWATMGTPLKRFFKQDCFCGFSKVSYKETKSTLRWKTSLCYLFLFSGMIKFCPNIISITSSNSFLSIWYIKWKP